MALADFQTSLARLVRAANHEEPAALHSLAAAECAYLTGLIDDPAFRFTVRVQRSWCVARAAKAGFLTLSILPAETRDSLLEDWVSSGGGTHSFVGAESAAFLGFIACRLPNPSHELTICRMESAALRSSEGSVQFTRPAHSRIDSTGCSLRQGAYSGVVPFYGPPELIVTALARREPPPPISAHTTTLLFAPGLDRLYARASERELALYERLDSPAGVAQLLAEGFERETMLRLLDGGVLEYVQ